MLPSRIANLKFIPFDVRKVLYHADPPENPYEDLFQHLVGRAVMDALGFTGLDEVGNHNTAVRSARVWFKFGENVEEYFEFAGVSQWKLVRQTILDQRPLIRKEKPKPLSEKL